jgi:hypothetical protein
MTFHEWQDLKKKLNAAQTVEEVKDVILDILDDLYFSTKEDDY